MFLIDTNIFLEILLKQEKSNEARQFLTTINPEEINVTDFSVYSIGIVLIKLGEPNLYLKWLEDLVESGAKVIRVGFNDMKVLTNAVKKYKLDFDDAYQYTVAKKNNLKIVSFDKDFSKTDKKAKTPGELKN